MVAMGVETLALRRTDFPDVGALERRPELLQGQLDPVAQCLAAGVFAAERGLQAVDDRQELLGKALQRVLLRRRCLCLGALAGVFCVATARSMASRWCSSLACASASSSSSGLSLPWDGSDCMLCSCMSSNWGWAARLSSRAWRSLQNY